MRVPDAPIGMDAGAKLFTRPCDARACPDPHESCRVAACVDGACGSEAAPIASACGEKPGFFCDRSGDCIRCRLNDERDGLETDVDCGGAGCREEGYLCGPNQACAEDADCESRVCDGELGLCVGSSCRDGTWNGPDGLLEGDVDCGGPCEPNLCARGQHCFRASDCDTGYCDAPEGQAVRGVCCGTPCAGRCTRCEVGTGACVAVPAGEDPDEECPGATNRCDGAGQCSECRNGVRDGEESGKDCGGSVCDPCGEGLPCRVNKDCRSCRCEEGVCVAPRCDNQIMDGCETDVDCGGPCGATCGPGDACRFKGDCASSLCVEGRCALR